MLNETKEDPHLCHNWSMLVEVTGPFSSTEIINVTEQMKSHSECCLSMWINLSICEWVWGVIVSRSPSPLKSFGDIIKNVNFCNHNQCEVQPTTLAGHVAQWQGAWLRVSTSRDSRFDPWHGHLLLYLHAQFQSTWAKFERDARSSMFLLHGT